MNALNRLFMIIIALLMIAIPVVMLLVAFGVIAPSLIDQYTNYQGALSSLGNLSVSSFSQQALTIIGIASALIALIAFILLLRELSFGRRVANKAIVEDTPGQETVITPGALKNLAEGAARKAGAVSPKVALESKGKSYNVDCKISAPASGGFNFTELADRTKENIQDAMERYSVSYQTVEITVLGIKS
ncbi:MAG: hypothetical protein WA990_02720 [Rubrobacteraceae bacterium]